MYQRKRTIRKVLALVILVVIVHGASLGALLVLGALVALCAWAWHVLGKYDETPSWRDNETADEYRSPIRHDGPSGGTGRGYDL